MLAPPSPAMLAPPSLKLASRARKRQGNVVVPGGNPTAPAAKARAPSSSHSIPKREEVTKAAGVKRKRIQAPPSSSHSIPERDAPAMPFNGVAPPASEVFDEIAGRTRLPNIDTKTWKLRKANSSN
ncbi:hypothetical protein D1007_47858 [Hordeum vulgare]|nr:hypothetical protein D1007_47858 [Hordeum vulgare]